MMYVNHIDKSERDDARKIEKDNELWQFGN